VKPQFRNAVLAASLAGLMGLAPAHAASTVTSFVDTLTDLSLGWNWNAAGGTATYNGVFWDAELTATFANNQWTVSGWYQHLSGPHGETIEAPHLLAGVFAPFGSFSQVGVDDHLGLPGAAPQHLQAHNWQFGAFGSAFTGLSVLQVAHPVPEPSPAAMLIAGLLGVGFYLRRRGLER